MNPSAQPRRSGKHSNDKHSNDKHSSDNTNNSPLLSRALLGLLTLLVLSGALISLNGWDQRLFLLINLLTQNLPDAFWMNVTNLGSTLSGAALISLAFSKRPYLVLHLLISGVLCTLIITALKHGLDVTRPHLVLDHSLFHFITTDITSPARPSGHTATGFFVAGTLIAAFHSRALQAILLAFAALIGVSRIAVGVHWPLDLVSGAFIGFSMGFVGARLVARYGAFSRRANTAYPGIGCSLILAFALYFFTDPLPYAGENLPGYLVLFAALLYALITLAVRLLPKGL